MMQPSVKSNASQDVRLTVGALLAGNELSRLEQTLLLAHAMSMKREFVLAHPEIELDRQTAARFRKLIERRLRGEPIAYLVGAREFHGLNLRVTPEVLIPRPETELIVDAALDRMRGRAAPRVLDLGTGSGAIALALARSRPDAAIVAVDSSPASLDVAIGNAQALSITNVRFIGSNWYPLSGERYDFIVSNPPYIATGDSHLDSGDVRFEPRLALVGGADGLDAIRVIVAGAPGRLHPEGWLIFEHGYDQGERCRQLLSAAGFNDVDTLRDLAGTERVCAGRAPSGA